MTSAPLSIPCALMRGGTSRGAVFLASDLPTDPARRDAVLLAAMGAGHELQVDGIGGGNPLTSKVAIVGPASRPGADVDYLFAQVKVLDRSVDTSPNCGNMLAAVGPFAVERHLVAPHDGQTSLRIHNVNTGKIVEARLETPGGAITYEGDARIDGVPGTAAPVRLSFPDAIGTKTGRLLPTGQAQQIIDDCPVSLVDAGVPLVIIRAESLGKTGHEPPAALDADPVFLARLEHIRRASGAAMGLGDVAQLVIPKPVLIAPAQHGGTFAARYFMPLSCHKALAVTGAVGLGTAATTPGTLVEELVGPLALPCPIRIEHPAGCIDLDIDRPHARDGAPLISLIRTARMILDGQLRLPAPLTV